MAEYIERIKALVIVDLHHGARQAYHKIRNLPAADVVPVVHGKWIDGADSFGAKRDKYRVCSRCNICVPCVTEVAEQYWQYCPNCGAYMKDGE